MALQWQKPGVNHVGEYQASGHTLPITGSANKIYLKYVASSITLSATADATASFYFGTETMNFPLKASTTATYSGKFLTFKVPANVNALVSITNIPSASYDPPSGSMLYRTQNTTFLT